MKRSIQGLYIIGWLPYRVLTARSMHAWVRYCIQSLTRPGVAGDEGEISDAVVVAQHRCNLGVSLDNLLRQQAVLRRQQRLLALHLRACKLGS